MPRFRLRSWLALCLSVLSTVASAAPDGLTYFHVDNVGSPIAATDAYGNVTWRENYLPHGEKRAFELSSGNNQQWFTGHFHDDDTKLTYMGARHYDPVLGRFLSVDPAGFDPGDPFTFNRYAYANNNPYRYSDPTGETVVLEKLNGGTFTQYVEAAQYLSKNERHRENIRTLALSKTTYTFRIDPMADSDEYNEETLTLVWNPLLGLQLDDFSIQSAALGLLHEVEHAADHDRDPVTHMKNIHRPLISSGQSGPAMTPDGPVIGTMSVIFSENLEEPRAMTFEAAAARQLSEPIRESHSEGKDITVPHPTYHRAAPKRGQH